MLYTRTGDTGTSGLFGTKTRIKKDSLLYEALGTVDELNAFLGVIRSITKENDNLIPWIHGEVELIQEKLFVIQAELAGANKCLVSKDTDHLEEIINDIETVTGNPRGFIISGESKLASLFDFARTVARRAERSVVRAGSIRTVSSSTTSYLNRLSSFLYAVARLLATLEGVPEKKPSY